MRLHFIGLFACAGLALSACGNNEQAAPPAPEVSVVVAEPAAIDNIAEAPARVQARRIAQVRARVDGIIKRRVYAEGSEHARERGLILADTKFEFGWGPDGPHGELLLIDEVLTPDSSRFWDAERYAPGSSPASFDKQFVRDFVSASGWDKEPPAPMLPDEVIAGTRDRYVAAYERLTGRSW